MSGAKAPENRKFEYHLPQDEIRVKKEATALAIIECLSDFNHHTFLTYAQIEKRATEKLNQIKSEYEVCNNIRKLNRIAVQNYIASYLHAQAFIQENPQELEKALKEIDEFGLKSCLQDLLETIEKQLTQQQKSEVL